MARMGTVTSLIKDPDILRLRDTQMLQMKVTGASYEEIAKFFNVSLNTVERAFSRIKQEGLARLAEDRVMEELVPAAIERFLTAITTEGDTQAALEVLKGVGALKKQATPKNEIPPNAAPQEEDSLLIYMRKSRALPESEPSAPLLEEQPVIDAEVNETPE